MISRYSRFVAILVMALGLLCGSSAAMAAGPHDQDAPRRSGDKDFVLDGHVFHDVGALWNHVTNFGLIGSQPSSSTPYSDAPSARWPGQDGLDYLWSGGLWVGATLLGQRHVTTGQYASEFWPTTAPDDTIYATAHGAIGGNRYPWPLPDDDDDGQEDEDPLNNRDDDDDGLIDEDFAAISNQDFRCVYSDTAAAISEIFPDHVPLGIAVTQQTLQWSNPVADAFIGYDFTVTNVGDQLLEEVYLGLFADFDIPASGDGSGDDLAGSWFGEVTASDGSVVPVAVAYMADGAPNDPAPGYVGFVLCGHTTDPDGQTAPQEVSVRSFQIFSGNLPYDQGGLPTNDTERYQSLQLDEHDANTPPFAADDYRVLISSGPFAALAPGEAITYQVSLVAGDGLDGLLAAAAEAVLTYRGRFYDRDGDPDNGAEFQVHWLRWEDEPVAAAQGSLVAQVTSSGVQIEVATNVTPEQGLTVVRVAAAGVPARRWDGDDLVYVGSDASGDVYRLVDNDTVAWPRTYDLVVSVDGVDYPLDQVELDLTPVTTPLLAASPNPFNPRLEIRFALPQAGTVRLGVYDLRGRLVRTLLNEVLPAGEGSALWNGDDETGRAAASGVYQLRLDTEGQLLERRVTLVR